MPSGQGGAIVLVAAVDPTPTSDMAAASRRDEGEAIHGETQMDIGARFEADAVCLHEEELADLGRD